MKNNGLKDILVKSLFIIGIVIVVLILAFAVIRVVPRLFSGFANVGGSMRTPFARNVLELNVEKDRVNSGELILISWNYDAEDIGVYEIEYSCVDYLEMELGTAEGNRSIECNTIYNLNSNSSTISLLPTLTRDNILADVRFDIRFVNRDGDVLEQNNTEITIVRRSGEEQARDDATIETEIITPSQTTEARRETTTTPTVEQTTQTQYQQTSATQSASLADLRIYDVHTIGDATIIFSVSNIGGTQTGPWYFNYATPDRNVTSSPIQPSLFPGEAIRYTLRLENMVGGDVAIALDPRNNVRESNIINNIAVIGIRGNRGGRISDPITNYADLEIYDLEVGRMSGSRFIEDDVIYESDTAAIRFTVSNIGSRDTGRWTFEVRNIPYNNQSRFESARQVSLRPGETREIVVEFERPDRGTYNLRVELDPRNEIREESTRNNIESIRMRIR